MKDFDAAIQELKDKRAPLYTERDVLTDKIMKLSKKIEKLRGEKEKEQMKQPMTPEQEMEYFLFEDGNVSGERYKAREKYWREKSLYSSGYFAEVEQVSLQMMLYKGEGDNLKETIETLEKVIPLLKVHADGVKRLDIFEHTCSENGSWSVEISETSFDLIVHRWHRKTVDKSFDNLRDLVEYVQQYHYYESSIDNEGVENDF